jgi:cyclase
MLRPRIIPTLLIHDGGLVKTRQFREPRYVGDPINTVRLFNEKEVDELAIFDVDATDRGGPDLALVRTLAAECRMPLCYGGGIRSVATASELVHLGVEKIALGAVASEQPEIVEQIAIAVGRQSVSVVLDVRWSPARRRYHVWTRRGMIDTERECLDAARDAESCGAGEIVINCIDRDGMMAGYDLELVKALSQTVGTPITILGGAGHLDHFRALFECVGVVGAAAGSFFVFKGALRAVLISYPDRQQRAQLAAAATSR